MNTVLLAILFLGQPTQDVAHFPASVLQFECHRIYLEAAETRLALATRNLRQATDAKMPSVVTDMSSCEIELIEDVVTTLKDEILGMTRDLLLSNPQVTPPLVL